jgi:DNA-binding transcriptional ArsR family regulator
MINLLNIMRALADPTRLRIVFLVRRLELSVGELVQILDQSQPRVSRHIRILDEAGLLERRKELLDPPQAVAAVKLQWRESATTSKLRALAGEDLKFISFN